MRFAEFKPLETERLLLRKLQLGDVYEYYERLFGDGDVTRYMLFEPHQTIMESLESVQQKLKRYEEEPFYCWAVERKEEGGLMGLVELLRFEEETGTCSFVYMLGCSYWNQGYGTEMLKAVFRFAFEELEVERIIADHITENVASGRVMEKAGMKHIGTETGKYEKLGTLYDAQVYEICNEGPQGLLANDYQRQAMTFLNPKLNRKDVLINGVMGLCGESGEAIDIVKKHLHQGHPLDREKLSKELGDIAWYLAETAYALDIPLEKILRDNLKKLQSRYPEGFSTEKSIHREA